MMALVLFSSMLIGMLLGIPVCFAILLACLTYLIPSGVPLTIIPQTLISGVNSFVLLAVPLFTLTGYLMEQTSLSIRLVDFVECIFGQHGCCDDCYLCYFCSADGVRTCHCGCGRCYYDAGFDQSRLHQKYRLRNDCSRRRFGSDYPAQHQYGCLWSHNGVVCLENVYGRYRTGSLYHGVSLCCECGHCRQKAHWKM